MLVLFETSLGFCLFKLLKDGKLADKDLYKSFESPVDASNLVKLQSIHRFANTAEAVEDLASLGEGKLSKNLKKFLVDGISGSTKETLAVSDTKLGTAIAKKLAVNVVSDSTTQELFRGIRSQLAALIGDVEEKDLNTMALGLSHSMSRHKLKFSPDKVDTMVVQAIALLDDLDKEINIYAMRTKEWYGWHFPEMAKIISDNLAYARCIKAMGYRTNAATTDFAEILPEDLEETLKAAAIISMGTEISITDLTHINLLAEQVISITTYRSELFEYLKNRMAAIAPNLTSMVGELVGARLISHSGSLMSLAKAPASTIQILGAEKALFRALKTKHDTPKYGLIFHASLVGSAPQQLKGKMARMVAGKTALAVRFDALADAETRSDPDRAPIGIEGRAKLEARLRQLEAGLGITSVRKADRGDRGQQNKFEMRSNGLAASGYNPSGDVLIPTGPPGIEVLAEASTSSEKKEKKKKRKSEAVDESMDVDAAPSTINGDGAEIADKAERKRLKKEAKAAAKAAAQGIVDATTPAVASTSATPAAPEASGSANGTTEGKKEKKSKKRKAAEANGGDAAEPAAAGASEEAPKKKKKKSKAAAE